MDKSNIFKCSTGYCVHRPEILTEKQLSHEFLRLIGHNNTCDYYSFSEIEQHEIFRQLVEYNVLIFENVIITFIEEIKKQHGSYVNISFDVQNYRWNFKNREGVGLISLVSMAYNKARIEAIEIIAQKLCMKKEYVFHMVPSTENSKPSHSHTPCSYIPTSLEINNEILTLLESIKIKEISGDIESYLCVYSSDQQTRILPATMYYHSPSKNTYNDLVYSCNVNIGFNPVPARLLNRDRIQQNPKANIFWTMDVLVGNLLDKMFIDSKLVDNSQVIVTSHYGGIAKLDYLDLRDLCGREIILMQEISRKGMFEVIELANKCYKAGASKVSIYPYPILLFRGDANAVDISSLEDPWERELADHATFLDQVELPSALYRKITECTLSPHEFITWGKRVGVFKDERDEDSVKIIDDTPLINVVNIFPSSKQIDEEIGITRWYLDEIISTESRTLIWSPTNSGKSLFALHLALALAYKLVMVVFKANTSRKVVIFDGETGKDQWKKRIEAIDGKHHIDITDKDNLWVMHKKGNNAYSDFDLFSQEWQERLLRVWKQHGIEVLILDNIISLCPEVLKSGAQAIIFFDFISRIESSGIAVITIHHSNKGKKEMKGVYELEALNQNIISLVGRESFAEDKNLPVEVRNSLNDAGALCKCVVTKCKMAPDLEYLEHYFHLPMDTGRWINLDKINSPHASVYEQKETTKTKDLRTVLDDEINDKDIQNTATDEIQTTCDETQFRLQNLSPDASKLFHYIKEIPTNTVNRKDVEEFLGCAEDKARNVIAELKEAKFLDQIGGGRNTSYKLR